LKSLKGFTLLEILVAVAISSFVALGVFGVLLAGQRTYDSGLGTLDLNSQIRLSLFYLTRELREAEDFSITTVDADDDSISFSTPNESSITYYRDVSDANSDGVTTQLIREYPAGTRKVIANNIASLEFSSSGDLIEIHLTASKTSGGRQYQVISVTKVEARNE
jgi:prepilin-type N-terminal cleavage/methylation domain-containing protein